MKRKIVRITESDLHKIIKSSVFNILSENVEDDNYMIGGEDDGNLGYFHINETNDIFPNSKVRNEDGSLKVMYRGGKENIEKFDRNFSKYSNIYGTGFYFTSDESHASQYGNVYKYYLNIENPLSTKEKTITPRMLLKLLNNLNENEDYGLYNYGYGSTPTSVLQIVYSKNRSDFEMLNDINLTCVGDLVKTTLLFNKLNNTKFDGFILNTETVVFDNEQIFSLDKLNENIENEYQAFHGSSADFDKFNHKKYLSSGAGSQSFGWGTYVSDDKVIADSYADTAFENTRQLVINGMLEDDKYSLSQYIIMNNKKFLKEYFPNLYDDYINSDKSFRNYVVSTMYDELFNQHHDEKELLFYVNRIKENLKRCENLYENDFILLCLYGFYHLNKVEVIGNKIIYEVDIPEDNGGNYIEWYEHFPPQFMKRVLIGLHNLKPQYLDKIAEHNYPFRSGLYGYLKHPNFNRILDILATEDGYHNFFASGMYTKTQDTQGSDVYHKLKELFKSDKAASLFLMNMCGFDGIKYPTGTRWNRPIGAKEDGYNYVLFNANNVKIINKERLGK